MEPELKLKTSHNTGDEEDGNKHLASVNKILPPTVSSYVFVELKIKIKVSKLNYPIRSRQDPDPN